MKQKGDLTRAERLEIEILLRKGYSMRAVAQSMERSPNTISYEVRTNSVQGVYDPHKAHAKARVRKRYRKLEWSKLNENIPLRNLVIEKLSLHWNPDEIAGYLKRTKEMPYVSKTAIYAWLRTSRGERYCVYLYTKRKYAKKHRPSLKRPLIPNRVDITLRCVSADNRTRYGHWEVDTVVGAKGTHGGLKTLQERKSRLVEAHKVHSMRPAEHIQVQKRILTERKVLSLTYDNGIENRDWEQLHIPSYFCTPYSSWEKGGVENANKMLRRYFPKGTNFEKVSQAEVDAAVALINNKPRKILGYVSSLVRAQEAGIIKSESVLILG